MSETTRSRAFEPFFSSKANHDGMGLACVRGIVNQSGGAIWLDSSPREGTTVAIYVPRVSSSFAMPVSSEPFVAGPLKKAPSILVVDDDAPVRRAIARLLQAESYIVFQADSPAAAIQLAVTHRLELAIAITDVVMPEMSGLEPAERLHRITPDVRVMYMSGYPADAIADPECANRCIPFLHKPMSKAVLIAAVREVIEGAHPIFPAAASCSLEH